MPQQHGPGAPSYTLQSFGQGAPQQPFGGPPAQPFGRPPQPQPYGLPPMMPPPQQQPEGDLLSYMSQVSQTIEQVRAKLHQAESIRGGYGYPPQNAYVDGETVNLLDRLYDQLGDLGREIQQQRGSWR